MLFFVKKVWYWIKTHWYIPLALLVSLFLLVLKMTQSSNKVRKKAESSADHYKKAIEEMELAKKEKDAETIKIEEKYKEVVEKIEEDFEEDSDKIIKSKKKIAKSIVKKHNGDLESLEKEFRDEFGF